MRQQQHNRAFDPSRIPKRKTLAGFDYRNRDGRKPGTRSMAGADWRSECDGLRVEHNGDCIAVYSGASLQFEIYQEG